MNLKLNKKGASELYSWMTTIYKGKTNWRRIADEWNRGSSIQIPDSIEDSIEEVPDYSKL